MLCVANFRNFLVRTFSKCPTVFSSSIAKHHLRVPWLISSPQNHYHNPRTRRLVTTMADSGSSRQQQQQQQRRDFVDVFPQMTRADDGGHISGGWKSDDERLSCGYSSSKGERDSMEDFYDVKTSVIDGQTVYLLGVFDGHGGSLAAEYLKAHLFENLLNHSQFISNTETAISETYKKIDSEFLESVSKSLRDDGSTALTVVMVGNRLYAANVGDSRVVMSVGGKAIPLSDDQKPNRSDERKRIEKAGGSVVWIGTWRVAGILAMSRAFGNRLLKEYVVAEPEIQDQEVNDDFELLVLATDGLWDVVPNEEVVSLARMEEAPEAAARKLTETALSRGSADNITCIVVRFHHNKGESDFSSAGADS